MRGNFKLLTLNRLQSSVVKADKLKITYNQT